MSNLIKVNEIYFDKKREQPVLKLADGSSRVIHLIPTGNCWVEYWVTPEQLKQSEEQAKARDEKLQAEAKARNEIQDKQRARRRSWRRWQ